MFNSLIKSTRAFSTTAARARVPVVGKFQPSLYLILPITYYLFNIYSMLTSYFHKSMNILICTKPFHHPYHVLTCNFCHSCFFFIPHSPFFHCQHHVFPFHATFNTNSQSINRRQLEMQRRQRHYNVFRARTSHQSQCSHTIW